MGLVISEILSFSIFTMVILGELLQFSGSTSVIAEVINESNNR